MNPSRIVQVLFTASLVWASSASAVQLEYVGDEAALRPLGREIARLASEARGTVGVAAVHLESGRAVFFNGNDRFPMASTYKVPIAVEVLAQVDAGERALDDLVPLRTQDIVDTAGAIRAYLNAGSQLTIRDLLELMLRLSDNIATDLLLEEVGGGSVVTDRMHATGVSDIRVDRSTRQIIGNWLGRPTDGAEGWIPGDEFNGLVAPERLAGLDADELSRLNAAFNADPRDTATPKAMAALLQNIWQRSSLSEASSALLIDIMERCETGENRLKGAFLEVPSWRTRRARSERRRMMWGWSTCPSRQGTSSPSCTSRSQSSGATKRWSR